MLLYAAISALYTLPQDGHEGSPGGGIFSLILLLLIFPWALAIVITVAKRKPIARWLGGLLIFVLIIIEILLLYDALRGSRETGDVQIIEVIFDAIVLIAEAYWLYVFSFADKAKRYLGV